MTDSGIIPQIAQFELFGAFQSLRVMLESFSYGIYCVIFAAFVRIRLKRTDKGSKALLYLLTANFIACTAFLALDLTNLAGTVTLDVALALDALYLCTNFISQVILIYRCWIMWRQPWVMVVPILLTLALLVISVTLAALAKTPSITQATPDWYLPTVLSFFSLSLAVNALVTGLIISKILTVYRDNQGLQSRVGHANKLGRDVVSITSILIESGVITFLAQLVQTLTLRFAYAAYFSMDGFVVMLYGISTAVVLVRVEMGLTYDVDNLNESSKTATGIRFAASQRSSDMRVTTTIA